MNIKKPSNVINLYRRYRADRMVTERLNTGVAQNRLLQGDVITYANEYDDTVISLYKRFQSNRGNNRERVIQSVTRLTLACASQQQYLVTHKNLPIASKTVKKLSLWARTKAQFTFDLSIGWQSTTAFSFMFVFVIVLISADRQQNEKKSDLLVNIPNYLIKHHSELTANIQPIIVTHLGFSSALENYQMAFRTGILLVELRLLARLNNQDKLNQVLVEAGLSLKQSNNVAITVSLDQLMIKLKLTNNVSSRINFIDEFEAISRQVFTQKNQLPLRELGKWLEISRLSIPLFEDGRSTDIKRLLQQGQALARLSRGTMSESSIVKGLLLDLEDIDEQSMDTSSGISKFKKVLKQIKAAML